MKSLSFHSCYSQLGFIDCRPNDSWPVGWHCGRGWCAGIPRSSGDCHVSGVEQGELV